MLEKADRQVEAEPPATPAATSSGLPTAPNAKPDAQPDTKPEAETMHLELQRRTTAGRQCHAQRPGGGAVGRRLAADQVPRERAHKLRDAVGICRVDRSFWRCYLVYHYQVGSVPVPGPSRMCGRCTTVILISACLAGGHGAVSGRHHDLSGPDGPRANIVDWPVGRCRSGSMYPSRASWFTRCCITSIQARRRTSIIDGQQAAIGLERIDGGRRERSAIDERAQDGYLGV